MRRNPLVEGRPFPGLRRASAGVALAIALAAAPIPLVPSVEGAAPTVGASPMEQAHSNNGHGSAHQYRSPLDQQKGHRVPVPRAQTGTPVGAAWTSIGPQPQINEKCCETSPSSSYGNASGRVTSLVANPTNS